MSTMIFGGKKFGKTAAHQNKKMTTKNLTSEIWNMLPKKILWRPEKIFIFSKSCTFC